MKRLFVVLMVMVLFLCSCTQPTTEYVPVDTHVYSINDFIGRWQSQEIGISNGCGHIYLWVRDGLRIQITTQQISRNGNELHYDDYVYNYHPSLTTFSPFISRFSGERNTTITIDCRELGLFETGTFTNINTLVVDGVRFRRTGF